MYIFIQGGRLSRYKKELYKDFVRWTGKKLLSQRVYRRISLLIEFQNPKKFDGKDDLAYCLPRDEKKRPRNYYIICISNKLKIMQTLVILGHEMVHIKQYASKELRHCNKTGYLMWKNSLVDDDHIYYYDLPWEIEANGRQKGLVYQWAKERGHDENAPWFRRFFG